MIAAMRFIPRPRLAFSLRTLLVLVALVCAWLAWERHVVLERRAAREAFKGSGVTFNGPDALDDPPATVPWVRRLFGDQPIQTIWIPRGETDAWVRAHARLFPEAEFARPLYLDYQIVEEPWGQSELTKARSEALELQGFGAP
jgi:hypothetical protein